MEAMGLPIGTLLLCARIDPAVWFDQCNGHPSVAIVRLADLDGGRPLAIKSTCKFATLNCSKIACKCPELLYEEQLKNSFVAKSSKTFEAAARNNLTKFRDAWQNRTTSSYELRLHRCVLPSSYRPPNQY